jgi:hypothetical protein
MTGRASQINMVPKRGNNPANTAKQQGMVFSPSFYPGKKSAYAAFFMEDSLNDGRVT